MGVDESDPNGTVAGKKVPGTKFGESRENSQGREERKRTGRGRYCENPENETRQTVYDHAGRAPG